MASFSISGIGSGLDINSIVSQLVAAERAGADSRISRTASTTNAQLSAIGTFRAAADALRRQTTALEGGQLTAWKTSVGEGAPFSATATGSGAQSGSYRVTVEQQAQAHVLRSAGMAGADTEVGEGDLDIHVGDTAFTVTIGSGDRSLAGIAAAINAAPDNAGVNARVVVADSGAHLVISSRSAGSDSALRIVSSGGDGGLTALDYDPGNSVALVETQAAQDARIEVDGLTVTRGSNSIADVIPGVTLNISGEAPGESFSLNINADVDATLSKINSLVAAYNATLATARQATRYDAATKTAGALQGDATLRGAASALRGAVSASGGEGDTLTDLGFKTATDGTLTVDSAALRAALAADPEQVARMLTGEQGLTARIDTVLDDYLGSDGRLQVKTDSLNARLKFAQQQQDDVNRRMELIQARYQAQFTALDTLVGQMNSMSNYLASQLATLG